MKALFLVALLAGSHAYAQKQGETFTYQVEIARQGDIDSGQVQFETRNIAVTFMGEKSSLLGGKQIVFAFGEHGKPPVAQFTFDGNRWSQAKGVWAYATANEAQCLQVGGNFQPAGSALKDEPLDICKLRASKESLATYYSIINMPTPLQYELEERGSLNNARPNDLAQAQFLPPEIVQHLNIRANQAGKFWYRAKMVLHTGGSSRP
ncbi:MAG: hypothetical protein ABL958_19790 [Bdellovibrionia bacterium]